MNCSWFVNEIGTIWSKSLKIIKYVYIMNVFGIFMLWALKTSGPSLYPVVWYDWYGTSGTFKHQSSHSVGRSESKSIPGINVSLNTLIVGHTLRRACQATKSTLRQLQLRYCIVILPKSTAFLAHDEFGARGFDPKPMPEIVVRRFVYSVFSVYLKRSVFESSEDF